MPKTRSRLAVSFSNAAHTITHYSMLMYPTVVLGLEKEFGLSYGELISLSVPGLMLYGLAALPAGWLGDRWSSMGMMAVFFFGIGTATMLTGLATSPMLIVLGLAGMGLFASIYHPVGIAVLVSEAESRGKALGINGVFGGAGVALAPVGTAFLMDRYGWQQAFWIPGAFTLTVGVFFVLSLRSGLLTTGPRQEAKAEIPPERGDMVRAGLVMLMTMLLMGLTFRIISVALPKIFAVRISEVSSGGMLGVGGMVTTVFLIQGVAQYVGGILVDRYPAKLIYRLSFLVQVPVLLVIANLYNLPLFFAAFVMVFFNIVGFPAENVLVAQYSPARWRATAYGVKFVVSLGVASLGVLLIAVIFEATGGFFWLFIAVGGTAALGFLVSLALPTEAARATTEAKVPGTAAVAPATRSKEA